MALVLTEIIKNKLKDEFFITISPLEDHYSKKSREIANVKSHNKLTPVDNV